VRTEFIQCFVSLCGCETKGNDPNSTVLFCFLVSVHHRRSVSLDVEIAASGFTKDLQKDAALLHPAGPESDEDEEEEEEEEEEDEEEESAEEENGGVQGVDMEEYKHAMLELEGLKLEEPQTDPQDAGDEDPTGEEETETRQEPAVGGVDEGEGQEEEEEEGGEEAGRNHDGRGEEVDACPELLDLSAANKEFKPFRLEGRFLDILRIVSYPSAEIITGKKVAKDYECSM